MEAIQRRIRVVRGQRVLLDFDLALLYDVQAKALHQAVTRNGKRFPADFMFQLSMDEFAAMRAQIVTSRWGSLRRRPYAFTEAGVAMLATVLRSSRAIKIGIEIMRTFVSLRGAAATHRDLARRVEAAEAQYDGAFGHVFEALRIPADGGTDRDEASRREAVRAGAHDGVRRD